VARRKRSNRCGVTVYGYIRKDGGVDYFGPMEDLPEDHHLRERISVQCVLAVTHVGEGELHTFRDESGIEFECW
jgi:hypothetical protein